MLVPSFEFTKGNFCERFPNEVEIEPCSLTLVCGNSGSGKSLFINYLAKLDSIKDDVYVSQTNSYPPLNYKVSEIISFLSIQQNSLDEFLNYIEPYFDLRPFLKKRLSKLSGGEKSFINLISSLFSSKNIIILDEPLNMISEENRKKAAELILEVSKYKTIFIVSHFREIFTDISDYVIEFIDGLGTVIKSEYKEKEAKENIKYKSINKLSGKRTRRYLKDDLPLIALFFVFTLCIQFVLFFSVAKVEIDKKVFNVEDTIYREYMNSLSFNPGKKEYKPGEEPDEDLYGPIKQENFGFNELTELGRIEYTDEKTDVRLKEENTSMYHHMIILKNIDRINEFTNKDVSFLSYDSYIDFRNDKEDMYNSTFHIGVAKDYCVGKCSNLAEDEIIVGRYYLEDYDFSTPIKAKYVYNPNWTYTEGESEEDFYSRKWLASGATIKDIKIVGRDSFTMNDIILPDVRDKPHDKLFNYLGVEYKENKNGKIRLLNNTSKDSLTLVKELNKRLIEEKGIHDRVFGLSGYDSSEENYISIRRIEKMMSFDTLYNYINNKKDIIKSVSIGFNIHDILNRTISQKKVKFVKDDSYIFKTFDKKLNRKFNCESDIILPYNVPHKEPGKKIELMGKSFTIYGYSQYIRDILGRVDESDYILSFNQIDNFKRPDNIVSYEDYGYGSITNVTISYDSPQKAIVEENEIKDIFGPDNPYLDTSTSEITKDEQKHIDEYFIEQNNNKKITSYISITLIVVGAIGFICLAFAFYFVFKKNYKVNRYKKKTSKNNYIIPSVVSIITILIVFLTCYMKSLPYYICAYYFNNLSLENVLANKIQNIVNMIGLVLISVIAIYLYLRNISFSKKKTEVKNKS